MPPSREQQIFGVAALSCAVTRLFALARSPWDWDEILFILALRDYDVTQHHPHPPGFPLFVGLAKLLRLVIGDDFRALQAVVVIASVLVFPAVFFFARAVGAKFETAIAAGLLCAFFPNVWFFGGTAFSDVPSMVLVTFAAALFFRDRYYGGAVALALAIAIRPQSLLIGLIPGILASRKRSARELALAVLIGVAIVGSAYAAAIQATGSLDAYRGVVRAHTEYIASNDSFRSPERPSLLTMAERFFVKPYGAPSLLAVVLTLFVVAGGFTRGRPALLALATFGPFALFAWLMLERFSVTRLSIGYMPMLAILAAEGIALVARRLAPAVVGVLLIILVAWTLPALDPVRTELSPPVAALRAIRQPLYAGHSMTKFVDVLAPGTPYRRVIDYRALPLGGEGWLLADVTFADKRGEVFSRPHDRLWNIARRQYFDVAIQKMERVPRFLGPAKLELPGRETYLRVQFDAPPGAIVTILLNGRVLERVTAGGPFTRDFTVTPAETNVLEWEGSEFGVQLQALSWGPA